MQDFREKMNRILADLFNQAETYGGLEYIFTLVRVEGITFKTPDPILEIQSKLKKHDPKIKEESDLGPLYCSLAGCHDVFALIANLINCAMKKPFNSLPFFHLVKVKFPDNIYPTTSQVVRELSKIAVDDNKQEIASMLDEIYPDDLLNSCLSKDIPIKQGRLAEAVNKCIAMLSVFLEIYFEERLKFKNSQKFYKLQKFEVLEFLVNDKYGLYGFRLHFSNGSNALFARHEDSTECLNINPGKMSFHVGLIDKLKDEWRVGEKLLYEIGLPGRYNNLGEWKPIIYPGKYEHLTEKAYSLSDDPDVQGALFYIICTAHWVIEFVVRTAIDLPTKAISYGGNFHLWKCPPLSENSFVETDFKIYDGWLELDSIDPDYIESAIGAISVILNSLAFAYDATIEWRPKYTTVITKGGYATPTEDDLKLLDTIFPNILSAKEFFIINAAIDWYNQGKSAKNVFNKFLCYYIALESVALSIADGKADFNLSLSRDPRDVRKRRRNECIKEIYKNKFSEDPTRFVEEAYFDCVVGIKKKIHRVVGLVFGDEHKHLKALFEKQDDGYSLNDIRGGLAHGRMTILDKEHEKIVSKRLPDIAEISREFLTRIILKLKPEDRLPSWSMLHSLKFFTNDPRTTLIANSEKLFPTDDWRIKPEWCGR